MLAFIIKLHNYSNKFIFSPETYNELDHRLESKDRGSIPGWFIPETKKKKKIVLDTVLLNT